MRNRRWWSLTVLALAFLAVSPTGRARGEDVVLTTTGAPLKVVVRVETSIREKPDPTSAGRPVQMFEFYYVLPPKRNTPLKLTSNAVEPALESGYFRIATGNHEKDEVGWIAKEDVVVWPHRQAVQLRPIEGRKPALFYGSDAELKSAFAGGSPSPISKEPSGGAGNSLMPLLAQFTLKTPAGDEASGYQVAYLHALAGKVGRGGSSSPAGGRQGSIELKQATLDVVFVIDATGSMGPFIEATKQAVSDLAARLAGDPSNRVPVRLGLVAYRDRVGVVPPDWYVVRNFWPLEPFTPGSTPAGTEINRFLGALNQVTASGGEDTPEDVLGGLREAVRMPGWNPNGFKHIILIGDASGHVDGDDPKNPERLTIDGIKAMMQPSSRENLNAKMICHAVRIKGEDPSDYARCEEQYTKLAEGVDFPGIYHEFDATDRRGFVDKLLSVITKSLEGLKVIKAAGGSPGGPAGAAPKPADDTPGLGLLLEMAAASKGEGDVPAFASGFVSSFNVEGKEQVEPYLLVQYGQFRTFQSVINLSVNAVRSAGEPGGRDVEKILQTLQIACTQLSINEPIKPDTPLHVIFSYLLGFPVRSDIFAVTPQVLASMTQEDFDQWTKKMEACDSIIRGYIDRPGLWKALGRSTSPESQYTFLRINELP